MGSDGCERCNQWRKKGRDVPGEEEKQHPSLEDGGGALSEVAGMARKPKTGKKMEMQGSGRTAGGLEGQDGAGRAWRGVRSGRKVSHAPSLAGAWVTVRRRRAAREMPVAGGVSTGV